MKRKWAMLIDTAVNKAAGIFGFRIDANPFRKQYSVRFRLYSQDRRDFSLDDQEIFLDILRSESGLIVFLDVDPYWHLTTNDEIMFTVTVNIGCIEKKPPRPESQVELGLRNAIQVIRACEGEATVTEIRSVMMNASEDHHWSTPGISADGNVNVLIPASGWQDEGGLFLRRKADGKKDTYSFIDKKIRKSTYIYRLNEEWADKILERWNWNLPEIRIQAHDWNQLWDRVPHPHAMMNHFICLCTEERSIQGRLKLNYLYADELP